MDGLDKIIQHKLMGLLGLSDVCVFYCEYQMNWPMLYISKNIDHYGYQAEDFLAGVVAYKDAISSRNVRVLSEKIEQAIADNEAKIDVVIKMYSPMKQVYWVDVRLLLEKDAHGRVTHLLGTLLDITDKVAIREEMKMFSQVVKQTSDIVKITDEKGKLVFVNQAFCDVTGYVAHEVLGRSPKFLKSELIDSEKSAQLWQTLVKGQTYRNIIRNRKKDGTTYAEEITITPVYDDEGDIEYYVSTGKDVSRRLEREALVEQMAMTDVLTDTCNRRRLDEVVGREIKRANRYESTFSLILLDLDYFKSINDSLGHQVGDDVLITVSRVIKEALRETDYLGRWGGEEFLVVVEEVSVEEALLLAEKLRKKIASYDFEIGQSVTASFGVAGYKPPEGEVNLFKRLDDALYLAKHAGRNRVEIACTE